MTEQVPLCINGISGNLELEKHMAALLKNLFELFKRKQASYGPTNISAFGELGCIVRMNDKMKRLIRLVWDARDDPIEDETVEDTYLDLANYALFAILVRRELWPT